MTIITLFTSDELASNSAALFSLVFSGISVLVCVGTLTYFIYYFRDKQLNSYRLLAISSLVLVIIAIITLVLDYTTPYWTIFNTINNFATNLMILLLAFLNAEFAVLFHRLLPSNFVTKDNINYVYGCTFLVHLLLCVPNYISTFVDFSPFMISWSQIGVGVWTTLSVGWLIIQSIFLVREMQTNLSTVRKNQVDVIDEISEKLIKLLTLSIVISVASGIVYFVSNALPTDTDFDTTVTSYGLLIMATDILGLFFSSIRVVTKAVIALQLGKSRRGTILATHKELTQLLANPKDLMFIRESSQFFQNKVNCSLVGQLCSFLVVLICHWFLRSHESMVCFFVEVKVAIDILTSSQLQRVF